MSHHSRYTEDLPQLAAEAYELSGRQCGTCRDLHALWTYIRLSRASIGVPDQASGLGKAAERALARGGRDVLIAGLQDTGLLALTARAGVDHGVNIVVLDICETPLELCRRFAKTWSLPIETIRQDLLELDIERRFDVVLVHCTLQFIAADRRADALVRMQRAIRPGGRCRTPTRPCASASRFTRAIGKRGKASMPSPARSRQLPCEGFDATIHGDRRAEKLGGSPGVMPGFHPRIHPPSSA